jgi:hypothetical protein
VLESRSTAPKGAEPTSYGAYAVVLDGVKVARVKRGETCTIETDAGHHEVRLAVDWCRSPTVSFELAAGQEARLRCWPNARPLTILHRATLGRANYIGLELAEVTQTSMI